MLVQKTLFKSSAEAYQNTCTNFNLINVSTNSGDFEWKKKKKYVLRCDPNTGRLTSPKSNSSGHQNNPQFWNMNKMVIQHLQLHITMFRSVGVCAWEKYDMQFYVRNAIYKLHRQTEEAFFIWL